MNFQFQKGLKGITDQYDESGYVIIKNVLDNSLVEEARQHVDWLLSKHPGTRPEHLHHTLLADDPFWVRLVSDPRLLDIAEQFIGSNIALFASHYICKPPKDGQAVLWHQDGSYWPLKPMSVITLWVALDPSLPENGCMKVIPKTHTMELQDLHERSDIPNVLASSMDESQIDISQSVNLILDPGDVSIHHPNIVHGSEANNSDIWRRGLTIRYIPTTTEVTDKSWPCVMLLRGEDVKGINTYVPFPEYREGDHMPFEGSENWPLHKSF